jgi:hypothetical protein
MAIGLVLVVGVAACGDDTSGEARSTETTESTTTSSTVPSVQELDEGPLEPGRYRDVLVVSCDDPPIPCPDGPPPPLGIELTVPDGWGATPDLHVLHPAIAKGVDISQATEGPDGAGLVVGWATVWVGLNSDPCTPIGHPGGHQTPDISVGPSVDDFVDAVVAHPTLDVSEPTDVTVGGYDGRSFTLTAPSDLSGCANWRPWDPGIYAQGPSNQWDVWALDIEGLRVVVIGQHFPGTPDEVRTGLRDIVDSMTFEPGAAG